MPASVFSKKILFWYKKNARDLPWRQTRDPYKIWISEIMLQQTTVSAVIPFYERWIKVFPTVKDVAKAPYQKILSHWQGLGYYQRARNLQNAAKIIAQEHAGKIPSDFEALRKLPGFGPYTIGAVLSIAYGLRYSIIDANVRRFIMRVMAIIGPADTTQDEQIRSFLDHVMPNQEMEFFSQALMEIGALICRSKEPLCLMCPVKSECQAYAQGIQDQIPVPKKKIFKQIDTVIAVVERGGKLFIQKRPPKGFLADMWEFPGGKVETGEDLITALKRELKEELNVEIISAQPLMLVKHAYTQFKVNLNVFLCQLKEEPKTPLKHKWVAFESLKKYPMPSGTIKIIDRLKPFLALPVPKEKPPKI